MQFQWLEIINQDTYLTVVSEKFELKHLVSALRIRAGTMHLSRNKRFEEPVTTTRLQHVDSID